MLYKGLQSSWSTKSFFRLLKYIKIKPYYHSQLHFLLLLLFLSNTIPNNHTMHFTKIVFSAYALVFSSSGKIWISACFLKLSLTGFQSSPHLLLSLPKLRSVMSAALSTLLQQLPASCKLLPVLPSTPSVCLDRMIKMTRIKNLTCEQTLVSNKLPMERALPLSLR